MLILIKLGYGATKRGSDGNGFVSTTQQVSSKTFRVLGNGNCLRSNAGQMANPARELVSMEIVSRYFAMFLTFPKHIAWIIFSNLH